MVQYEAQLHLNESFYKTVYGKVIVKDGLLNFLAEKNKTLSQDKIFLLTI